MADCYKSVEISYSLYLSNNLNNRKVCQLVLNAYGCIHRQASVSLRRNGIVPSTLEEIHIKKLFVVSWEMID